MSRWFLHLAKLCRRPHASYRCDPESMHRNRDIDCRGHNIGWSVMAVCENRSEYGGCKDADANKVELITFLSAYKMAPV